MAPGGTTPWPATPVDGIAAIGLSMDSGGAADAAAKLRAAMQSIANAAAVYERIVHSLSEHLEGDAADAAHAGARHVAHAAVDNATNAGRVGSHLDDVAAILDTGRSAAEAGAAQVRIAASAPDIGAIIDGYSASAIKAQLDSTMDSLYSNPMVGAHSSIDVSAGASLDMPGGRGPGARSAAPADSGSPALAFGDSGAADTSDTRDAPGPVTASRYGQADESGPTPVSTGLAPSARPTAAPDTDAGAPVAGPSAPVGIAAIRTGGPAAGPASPGSGSRVAPGPAGTLTGRTTGTVSPLAAAPSSRVTGPAVAGRPAAAQPNSAAARAMPRSGIPPATAPGSRAGTKADEHHRAASYLRGRHHCEAAIGPLPLVAPPVLGDWTQPAHDAEQGSGSDDDRSGRR